MPSTIGRRRRRRRLLTRAVPLAVVAVRRSVPGSSSPPAPAGPNARLVVELRDRLGARRLPAHVLAAGRDVAAADVGAAVRGGDTRRRRRIATLLSVVPSHVGNRVAGAIPVRMRARTRAVRHAARDAERAARRQRLGSDDSLLGDAAVPRAACRREAGAPDLPRAARDPARERRHAAGAGPRPDLADSRRSHRRSSATLGPIPADEATQYAMRGIPRRTPRSGSTAWSTSSSPSSRGRPAASCSPASACSRASRRPRAHGHDDDQPDDGAGGDQRDRPVGSPGSPRWTRAPAPAGRCAASRSRPSSRPARR